MPLSSTPPLFALAQGFELILASASPRRRQFLTEWGIPFQLVSAKAEEPRPAPDEPPDAYTRRAAVAKARAVAKVLNLHKSGNDPNFSKHMAHHPQVILSADTVVTMNGDILGKPKNSEHARCMLERLNGHGHEVISAVCLLLSASEAAGDDAAQEGRALQPSLSTVPLPGLTETHYGIWRQLVFSDTSRVFFHHWQSHVLNAYVRTGEPDDKAGAYAIQGQGAMLIERLEGSWSTVVGLPMTPLAHLLLYLGVLTPALPCPEQAG